MRRKFSSSLLKDLGMYFVIIHDKIKMSDHHFTGMTHWGGGGS